MIRQAEKSLKKRLSHIERQMADDLAWAADTPDVQQHHGKFVIVHRKRIVGVGAERDALVAHAATKEHCAPEDLVVVVVPGLALAETPR